MTKETRTYTLLALAFGGIQAYFSAYPRSGITGPAMSSWQLGVIAQYWPLIAMTALVVVHFFFRQTVTVPSLDSWNATKKTEIVGHKYESEKVVLDSKMFVNCEFKNVTFVFHGTGPFDLVGECKITAPFHLETDHVAIRVFNHFSEGMTKMLEQIPGAIIVTTKSMVDTLGNKIDVPPLQLLKIYKPDDPKA